MRSKVRKVVIVVIVVRVSTADEVGVRMSGNGVKMSGGGVGVEMGCGKRFTAATSLWIVWLSGSEAFRAARRAIVSVWTTRMSMRNTMMRLSGMGPQRAQNPYGLALNIPT